MPKSEDSALRAALDDIDGASDMLGDIKEAFDDLGRDDLEERVDSIITDLRDLARSVAADLEDEETESDPDGEGLPPVLADPADL